MPFGPRLLVRVDAGPDIGSGHAMRCLTLANEWARHGEVILAAKELDPTVRQRWDRAGHRVAITDDPASIARLERSDVIVVDGYHISVKEHALFAAQAPTLLVDDFGLTPNPEGLPVLDGNLAPGRYPPGSLTGPEYALVHPGFGPAEGSGLLISLGSNAPVELVERILSIVTHGTLVIGGMQEEAEDLARLATRVGLDVLHDVHDMPAVMRKHSHAIIAGGSTALELAACGIPCIVIPFANNQVPVAKAIEDLGLGERIAGSDDPALGPAVARLLSRPPYPPIVDGRGARRVCAWLRSRCLLVRPVVDEDKWLVFEWANDPEMRAMAYNTNTISESEHDAWWEHRMSDPGSHLYIVEQDEPIGFIWFRSNGEDAAVSVNVAPRCRGAGWGAAVIRAGTDKFQEDQSFPVVAGIRHINPRSRAAFLDAGYRAIDGNARFPDSWVLRRDHVPGEHQETKDP